MAQFPNMGAFVPTTNIWDPTELISVDLTSDAFREILIRLYQNLNRLSLAVNTREAALYPLQEFVTGQVFFPNPSLNSSSATTPVFRPTYRKVINFGALPNAGTKSVAHNIPITSGYTFTHIYGAASDTTGNNYIPLPYASPTLVNNIELNVDATNINIITGSNRSNFTVTYVIVEYLKF